MIYSEQFKKLQDRVGELRKRFLPRRYSKTGKYSVSQKDFAQAYSILVHAEVEHYLEQRALEIAGSAFDLWKKKGKASRPLVACLAARVGINDGLPKKIGTSTSVSSIAGKAWGHFRHLIINNNGVKSENILSMLLAIGLEEGEIDSAWLATMDGFGTKRGKMVHTSGVAYEINPADEYDTVKQIISGLKILDKKLNNIQKSLK